MKRFVLLLISIALAVSLYVCSQEKSEEKPKSKAEAAGIQLKTVAPFTYVGLKHVGPYQDHSKVIDEFLSLAEKQELNLSGPMMGFYYNNPEEVPAEKLSWMIAFEVEDTSKVKPPLETGTFQQSEVLSYLHIGSPENTAGAYHKLHEYMNTHGLQPAGAPIERFLSPHTTSAPPESLKTEIWFPVNKAK